MADPAKIAINPETDEVLVLAGDQWVKPEKTAIHQEDATKAAYLVGGQWIEGPAAKPREKGVLDKVGDFVKDEQETSMALGSGIIAAPIAGLAGIAQGAKNVVGGATGLWEPGMQAGDRVAQVSKALTYEPESAGGKAATGAIGEGLSYVGEKPGEFVGEKARLGAQALGASPEVQGIVGAGANTLTQAAAQVLLGKGAGALGKAAGVGEAAARVKAPAVAAAEAESYAKQIGLDWGKLPQAFQDKMKAIAASAKGFQGLNPDQVARQARIAEAGIKDPSRGQVTRDPVQREREQQVKATGAGKELREADTRHNRILVEGVERLRAAVTRTQPRKVGELPGTADLQTGRSVQDKALRPKAEAARKYVDKQWQDARRTGELEEKVDVTPLIEHIDPLNHVDPVNVGWVRARLKVKGAIRDVVNEETGEEKVVGGELSLNELERIRQHAVEKHAAGGVDAADAFKVRQIIDGIMDTTEKGGPAFRRARQATARYKAEFENQKAVQDLTSEKPGKSDRRLAVEETGRATVLGKLEDLQTVKRSLLTGPDAAIRAAGKAAWRDIKGWGLDYIREQATKGPSNELGDPKLTRAKLQRALDNIGDANLDELYGKSVRMKLRGYEKVLEDLEEPSTGTTGSPTLYRILTFLDTIGGYTKYAGGGVATDLAGAVIKKGAEVLKGAKTTREAQKLPVDEAVKGARTTVNRERNARAATRAAPAALLTPQTYQGDER